MVVVERERDGSNVLAWVVALILVVLLVVGLVWLWQSGVFGGERETNINIEVPEDGGTTPPEDGGALPDDGGSGGGTDGGGGGTGPTNP